MEDFALVEADFQQYYRLNLDAMYEQMRRKPGGFLRYARLYANLPPESRIMKKLNPVGTWSWSKETASRTLLELSSIKAILYNSNRRKGQRSIKPDKQFQPDYVQKAKDSYADYLKEEQAKNKERNDALKRFWQRRNPEVKFL